MAATWNIEIQVTDLVGKDVTVTATRTDGADVWTKSVEGKYDTVSQTPQQLLVIYTDLFWDQYQQDLAKQTQIDALIGQAETALSNALNAKETP